MALDSCLLYTIVYDVDLFAMYVSCRCMKVVTAQIYGITEQLQCLGVRGLELDLHYSESRVLWCSVCSGVEWSGVEWSGVEWSGVE